MVDCCEITAAPAGPGTLDETTLAVTHPAPDVLYQGPCQVQMAKPRPGSHGEADVAQADVAVRLPAGTYLAPRPGATLTVTATADPDLQGVDLEVVGSDVGTGLLTRTVFCRRRVAFARPGGAP